MRRSFFRLNRLSFEQFDSIENVPRHTVSFWHGILGSKKNWKTVAKNFIELSPSFSATTIDHRGHGESIGDASKPNTVRSCAEDLNDLYKSEDYELTIGISPPTILSAHSFGGKVALEYLKICKEHNDPIPKYTWILDSLPGKYVNPGNGSHQETVYHVMNVLANAPSTYPNKYDAMAYLGNHGIAKPIAQWLATSLVPVDASPNQRVVRYCFDMNVILELFEDFQKADYWDYLENFNQDGNIYYIRAGKNKAWSKEVLDRFAHITAKNPRIKLITMYDVGHWVHVDDLKGLLQIINENSKL